MATRSTLLCDACGSDQGEMVSRGIARKRDFCAKCLPRVDEYLESRRLLQVELVTEWQNGLEDLEAQFSDLQGAFPH